MNAPSAPKDLRLSNRGAVPDVIWTLVTGNFEKLAEIQSIISFPIIHESCDLDEVQSLDLREIVKFKVRKAYEILHKPVMVEDVGLHLEGYGGFPGPLVRWILKASGSSALCRMADGCGNRVARATCIVGATEGSTTLLAEGTVRGTVTENPRGKNAFGWDDIFIPENSIHTYAEIPREKKNSDSHRTRAWRTMETMLRDRGMV
ncbi:MAG TPA: non-canonical purine NTP pyrophosphatase [Thermoanaerobaculia bacterium]|nr:non-canonical purine NTP pyrophosphatase [Thermoanaerobaculia bacterium]HUM30705.1 non-canonical purine NTP pyrophosphatase [Thermoanaerobaculia bacterium]HXK68887.1 non-canonical purine NTP pyrophosphatase [Thermoanaerobaculia bacterium]